MTKYRKSTAGSDRYETFKNGTDMSCRDCLFWYRCKLGGIDCELKER